MALDFPCVARHSRAKNDEHKIMIKPGDLIPNVTTWCVNETGAAQVDATEVLSSGKVVLFTVPGAFTPTCHNHHLPGYVASADQLTSYGINKIVCASVNDHHVMTAWAKNHNALGKVEFLADFDASLAQAMGLDRDLSRGGLGNRYLRAALILDNGRVEALFVDEIPGQLTNTGATGILAAIKDQTAKKQT